MPFLNKDIPIIVVTSCSLIFLLFLLSILYQIELIISLMFVMPITVVSTTGMVVSYKHKVVADAKSDKIRARPKKFMDHADPTLKQKPTRAIQKKTLPLKSIPRQKSPKDIPKKEKKGIKKLEPITPPLSTEELEELRKTELEVDVQKQKFTCVVHKGPIEGNLFLCPHCKTFYCSKCARVLKEKGEGCWSCGKELETTKKIPQEIQKSISSLNSLINHYKIRINTLNHRLRVKQIDKMEYLEQKEDLSEKMNRHVESLNKLKKKYLDFD